MKFLIALVFTIVILSALGLLLYFYLIATLFVAACITLSVIIGSIVWALGKYNMNEIIDPIRERYKMNTVWSLDFGSHPNIDDAAHKNREDINTAKRLLNTDGSMYRRIGLKESLPDWIITQAFPFLAVSAPKWIIAVIIGVLIIRFHEDIIPHSSEKTRSPLQNEITFRVKVSGDIQKGEDMLDSTIDVSDYCMRAHSNSNVIVLSNNGCN